VASEVPLSDLSFRGAAEWDTHMLQLINGPGGIFDHDLDSILIAQIIASLYGIKKIPFPVVLFFVTKGSSDSPLSDSRMRPRRKNFTHNGHIGLVSHLHSGSKPCQARSYYHNVVFENHDLTIFILSK
jgi:hypothetical protein